MDRASLLREARKAAALTQTEVARRAATAQSAVAAYESGERLPGFATLDRLLSACDHDLVLVARPRTRPGVASLAELAEVIHADLAASREGHALRQLVGFTDGFRASSRPGRLALTGAEPPSTGDRRFDAALAGLAEFCAADAGLPVPSWVNAPGRFVEPFWFVARGPAFHAYVLARTPAALLRHGVLMAREVFDRA
ncbi:MAG: helix-turn-helix transcriptional regulator [Candidatus Dormibacteria bacterium]|jgi:transcriptional regulator with XRE-family HTH domain